MMKKAGNLLDPAAECPNMPWEEGTILRLLRLANQYVLQTFLWKELPWYSLPDTRSELEGTKFAKHSAICFGMSPIPKVDILQSSKVELAG